MLAPRSSNNVTCDIICENTCDMFIFNVYMISYHKLCDMIPYHRHYNTIIVSYHGYPIKCKSAFKTHKGDEII